MLKLQDFSFFYELFNEFKLESLAKSSQNLIRHCSNKGLKFLIVLNKDKDNKLKIIICFLTENTPESSSASAGR